MVDTGIILRWFSNELTLRMEEKGFTHRHVALNSRTMPHNIIDYMNGKNFPRPWTLVLIAECLECSIDELLGYEGIEYNHSPRTERAFYKYPNEDSFTPYLRNRIVQKMSELKMDEEKLATQSGVTLQTIKRYLCVHSGAPQMPNLIRICDAFECTPSELIGY